MRPALPLGLLCAALLASACGVVAPDVTTPIPGGMEYPLWPSATPGGPWMAAVTATPVYPVLPQASPRATATATPVLPTHTPRPTSTPFPTQPPPRTPIALTGLLTRDEAIASVRQQWSGMKYVPSSGAVLTLTAALTTEGEVVRPGVAYRPELTRPVWVMTMQTEFTHLSISGPAPGLNYLDFVGQVWVIGRGHRARADRRFIKGTESAR